MMFMSRVEGYIFRITAKQWVSQVFEMAIYYTNIRRKLNQGQTILFMHRTNIGDAIVGYGMVDAVKHRDELSELEKAQCEKGGWKGAIEFKYVKKFDNPIPIRQTFLRDSKLRGRYLHGLSLKEEQVNSLISQRE